MFTILFQVLVTMDFYWLLLENICTDLYFKILILFLKYPLPAPILSINEVTIYLHHIPSNSSLQRAMVNYECKNIRKTKVISLTKMKFHKATLSQKLLNLVLFFPWKAISILDVPKVAFFYFYDNHVPKVAFLENLGDCEERN